MRKRGQFSTEYILITAVALTLLILGVVVFIYTQDSVNDNTRLIDAKKAVDAITDTSDQLHALSPGTRNTLTIRIPKGAETLSFSGNEVSLTLQASQTESTDVVSKGKFMFSDRVYTNPPEGVLKLQLGLVDVPSGQAVVAKTCVVLATEDINCVDGTVIDL